MTPDILEWLNLAVRWLHVTAGIAWIGSSFYFIWLDNHLVQPNSGEASGELWSVHGGGFYHNEKYQVAPSAMPDHLHWFKWEAYFTWISGFSLLVLVYYVGARNYLIDPSKMALTPVEATGIGLAALATGWIFYDLLCRSPLGRNNKLVGVIWFLFLVGAAIVLNSIFSSRGAYLHIGAMIGTAMVANVFFVIIPNQRKVVADLVAGRDPDPKLGQAAKQRSLHNNYMTLPVLFIMISPHYPMTFGAPRPWLVLALLGLTGVAVRHVFNLRHKGQLSIPAIGVAVGLALTSVTYVTFAQSTAVAATSAAEPASSLHYAAIAPIISRRCSECHAEHPTNPAFAQPPMGVVLDNYAHVSALAPKIKQFAVDSQVMPLGNVTHMTKAERAELGAWISQGAKK